MRGKIENQSFMLCSITPDQLIPQDHPIRRIKPMVDQALKELSPVFNKMYDDIGRPSIPPEHLLKACLLTILYSIRSERQFCERLQYDLLFKWFLDLNVMDPSFDASSFSKNRQRLLKHQVAREFFEAVLAQARSKQLLSADHFSVDGTLLEAWASMKSFKPKDGGEPPKGAGKNPSVDFHGEQRTNDTHASTTDPEARLAKKGKGKEAKLCFGGHLIMENRNGLATDVKVTTVTGTAETDTALLLLDKMTGKRRITLGADKGYDTKDFVTACRDMMVTPHVARRQYSIVDGRTTRHEGYQKSLKVRKRIEEIFGWIKTVGGGRKLRYKGIARNQLWAEMAAAAYNLMRMVKLLAASPALG